MHRFSWIALLFCVSPFVTAQAPSISCEATGLCPAAMNCVNGICVNANAPSPTLAPLPSLSISPPTSSSTFSIPRVVVSSTVTPSTPSPSPSACAGIACTADSIKSSLSPAILTAIIVGALILVAGIILVCCRCVGCCCFGTQRKSRGGGGFKRTKNTSDPLNASVAVVTNDQVGRMGPAPLPANYSRPADLMRDVVKEERVEMIPLDNRMAQQQSSSGQKTSRNRYPSPHVPLLPPVEGYNSYPGPHSAPLPSPSQNYPYANQPQPPPPAGFVVRDQPRGSFQEVRYRNQSGESRHSLPRPSNQSGLPPAVPLLPPVQQHSAYNSSTPPGPILAAKTSPPRGKGYFGFWDPYGYFRQGYRDEHGTIHYGIFDDECRFHFGGVGASEPIDVRDEDMARDIPLPDQVTTRTRGTESPVSSLARQPAPNVPVHENPSSSQIPPQNTSTQPQVSISVFDKQNTNTSMSQIQQPHQKSLKPSQPIPIGDEQQRSPGRRDSFGGRGDRIGGLVGSPQLSSSPYPTGSGSGLHPLKHDLPWMEPGMNPVSAAAAAVLAHSGGVPYVAYTASMDAYDGGGSHRDSFGGDYEASHGYISTSLPRPPPTHFPASALQPQTAQIQDETAS